jgi:hypothetical protein
MLALTVALFLDVAVAPPQLQVVDPLQFRVDGSPPSFLVFSSTDKLSELNVTVRDLRDPSGTPITLPVKTNSESTEVTTAGTRVAIEFPPQALTAPGDYHATLVINAKSANQLVKAATFTRPKPDIASPALLNSVLRIYRPFPGVTASDDWIIDISNRGALSVPSAAIWGGNAVADVDPKFMSKGSIEVVPATQRLDSGITKIRLRFSNFRDAGLFQSKLYVRSFPNTPPDEFAFKIAVTDPILWPLFTIAAGVCLALGVKQIADRLRPAEQNRLRVIQLRQRIARLRALTSSTARVAEIDDLAQRLTLIEREIDSGDFTQVSNDLMTLTGEITQEAKTLLDEQRDARNGLAEMTQRIAALEMHSDDTHKKTVEELRDLLNQAQQQVDGRDYAGAVVTINNIRSRIPFIESATIALSVKALATVQVEQIAIVDPPAAWETGRELSFAVNTDAKRYVWNFGEGEMPGGARMRHAFSVAGTYTIGVSLRDENDVEQTKLFRKIEIHQSALDDDYSAGVAKLRRIDWSLAIISALIATTSGIWLLYAGHVFGTPANYLEAFLWGFGIDNGVRGVAAVMQKVS